MAHGYKNNNSTSKTRNAIANKWNRTFKPTARIVYGIHPALIGHPFYTAGPARIAYPTQSEQNHRHCKNAGQKQQDRKHRGLHRAHPSLQEPVSKPLTPGKITLSRETC